MKINSLEKFLAKVRSGKTAYGTVVTNLEKVSPPDLRSSQKLRAESPPGRT